MERRIARFALTNRGNPDRIMSNLTRICKAMDNYEFVHPAVADLEGYDELLAACSQ